jgi:hypothetical protein
VKHTRLATTLATAGMAVIAGSALFAVPSQATADIQVTATQKTSLFAIPCQHCVLDSHPKGAHVGGTEYDAGVLTDAGGAKVGRWVLQATGVTPFVNGRGHVQLVGTIVLGGGQLTFQGLEDPPLDGGVAAITGGTGTYEGASGEITYTDKSDTVTTLVIRLD